MGSRHLSTLLLHPAPLTRISIPCSTPSIRCLLLPPVPRVTSIPHRHFNTSLPTHSTQPQRKEEPKISPVDTETTAAIDELFDIVGPSKRAQDSSDELNSAKLLFGSDFLTSRNKQNAPRPQRLNFNPDDMLSFPSDPVEPVQAIAIPEEEIKYPRLNPAYGRTVNLDPGKGRDIVRAINMLGSLMARNRVRNDFTKQRYHERPGLKRKRLHSERWRSRFKNGFNGVCQRVTELTRKGW